MWALHGILGSRPQQTYATFDNNYTPIDLEQAFHTMSLHLPDTNWHAETGTTSHMTNNSDK